MNKFVEPPVGGSTVIIAATSGNELVAQFADLRGKKPR